MYKFVGENCRVAALIFELKRQRILVLLRDTCEFWICLRNLARNESCLCFVDVIDLSELLFLVVRCTLHVSSHEPRVTSHEPRATSHEQEHEEVLVVECIDYTLRNTVYHDIIHHTPPTTVLRDT